MQLTHLALAIVPSLTLTMEPGAAIDTRNMEVGFDLGALRDQWVASGELRRPSNDIADLLIDLASVQLFDLILQTAETAGAVPNTFVEGHGRLGISRTLYHYSSRGFDLGYSDAAWKDGNHGSFINTIHATPHFLNTSYFLARGHHPVLAALAGMFSNVVMHESVFEPWEAKSLWDLLFNSLGVLFAVVPNLGSSLIWNPVTQSGGFKFYAKTDDGYRLGVNVEQVADFTHLPIADRPAMPNDLALELIAPIGDARLGVIYRMKSDLREKTRPLAAFQPLDSFELTANLTLPASIF